MRSAYTRTLVALAATVALAGLGTVPAAADDYSNTGQSVSHAHDATNVNIHGDHNTVITGHDDWHDYAPWGLPGLAVWL